MINLVSSTEPLVGRPIALAMLVTYRLVRRFEFNGNILERATSASRGEGRAAACSCDVMFRPVAFSSSSSSSYNLAMDPTALHLPEVSIQRPSSRP